MSLKSFTEMLDNLKGTYNFDFSKEDDCKYIFESYGGEDNMKELFPRTYESLVKARSKALEMKNNLTVETEPETCSLDIGNLCIKTVKNRNRSQNNPTNDSVCKLTIPVRSWFVDNTKNVQDEGPADSWKGVTIQAKIKKAFEPGYVVHYSKTLLSTNSYTTMVESRNFMKSEIDNQQYNVTILAQGCDPAGNFQAKAKGNTFEVGEAECYTINNILIDDPAPKNDKHRKSQEIVMLYGRLNEQQRYQDADYKDGDYLNNAFDSRTQTVHLLMPLKGRIQLEYGVQPIGLFYKEEQEFVRSKATYDYKDQVFWYRNDIDTDHDEDLYTKMLPCFTQDKYDKGRMCNIYFDIQISETGRSALDWHADVMGIQDGNPKTIILKGAFSYLVKNQIGVEIDEGISIVSATKEDLEKWNEEYYTYKKGYNTIYIPPITIYWGCFAGDVLITMFDGTQKKAGDIKAGDLLLGYQNKKLKVESIVTGNDQSIYLIETDHGNIKVSGGHPMMCDGSEKRAFKIKPQDRINLAEGSTAEVTNVSIVEYNDTVYNFTFEGETEGRYIIANGFYAGDLKMQNTKKEYPKKEPTQEDQELFEEAKRFQEMLDNALD